MRLVLFWSRGYCTDLCARKMLEIQQAPGRLPPKYVPQNLDVHEVLKCDFRLTPSYNHWRIMLWLVLMTTQAVPLSSPITREQSSRHRSSSRNMFIAKDVIKKIVNVYSRKKRMFRGAEMLSAQARHFSPTYLPVFSYKGTSLIPVRSNETGKLLCAKSWFSEVALLS